MTSHFALLLSLTQIPRIIDINASCRAYVPLSWLFAVICKGGSWGFPVSTQIRQIEHPHSAEWQAILLCFSHWHKYHELLISLRAAELRCPSDDYSQLSRRVEGGVCAPPSVEACFPVSTLITQMEPPHSADWQAIFLCLSHWHKHHESLISMWAAKLRCPSDDYSQLSTTCT